MAGHRLLLLLAAALALGQAAVLPKEQLSANDELYKLPPGLLIGGGVSATQVEGATSDEGKAESIMDHVVHTPGGPLKVSNDVAADHYHRYKEDLAMAKQMKMTSHRFSISWSRILPKGDLSVKNQQAIDHYREYIQEIRNNGMEPMVTMYHFDHPWTLEQETGGWTNRTMVDYFIDYADLLFKEFGSNVKYWNPINEGNMYCIFMPGQLDAAGLEKSNNYTFYQCLHNTVLAHARTYRLYKTKYQKAQQGFVGTSVLIWPATPETTDYADVMAANTMNDVFGGTSLHPVVYGDYPEIARNVINKRSEEQGLPKSKLPYFTDEDKKVLIGDGPSTDFIALNVYSGFVVKYEEASSSPNYILGPIVEDLNFVKRVSGGGFGNVDENVIKNGVLWAWNNYRLPIVITENGFGDVKHYGVNDYNARGNFYSTMLRSLVGTMKNYSVPVISFHAWSLLDSFEFSGGYDQRPFGLIHVDYAGETLNRTIKESSKFFIEMFESGYVPYVAAPSDTSSASNLAPCLLLGFILQSLLQF